MSLISVKNVSLAFGAQAVLDNVCLEIEAGERISLLGRNGSGKSTFLRVLQGIQIPDEGSITGLEFTQVATLDQEVPFTAESTIYEVLSEGVPGAGALLKQYHQLTHDLAEGEDAASMSRLAELQHKLEDCDAWGMDQKIRNIAAELNMDCELRLSQLSGGMIRKVLLAKALMSNPKLLLLDEPTNHLDINTIEWLENFLLKFEGALLYVSHDRTFIQKLSTRIIELDRGHLSCWNGGYSDYLERKQHELEVEQTQNAKFDKKLAQEEAWIRQGIKARRTRNEGRVRALKAIRAERAIRRDPQAIAKIKAIDSNKSGKAVAEFVNVNLTFGQNRLLKDFSLRILRGDRVALIGPNGIGKSSLIKLLLGTLKPDSGSVELGTKLEIAYFDQQREQLQADKNLIENLNLGSDVVTIGDKSKHVIAYLQDFLFTPKKCMEPVKNLSGGERNRLLLARILSKASNLLILDEPTNDLDVETLELLEDLLLDYKGTVLVVSHDRSFINNVVSSTLVFEGNGRVTEYVGAYDDWLRQSASGRSSNSDGKVRTPISTQSVSDKSGQKQANIKTGRATKLSYKDQRELEQLPALIERLELEKNQLEAKLGEAGFYQQDKDLITSTLEQIKCLQEQIEQAYLRWERLDI